MSPKILIVAGGTGGHVFPGLAVADALRKQGAHVEWVGTRKGIESKVVPNAGITMHYLEMQGIRRSGWRRLLKAPFLLLSAFLGARRILNRFSPDVVLTMGGYVTAPVGLAAWVKRVPVVVHEQNAIFGLTNRILKHFAKKTMVAFPGMGEEQAYIQTGNPIRHDLVLLSQKTREAISHPSLKVLVLGGSLGALAINQMVPQALALMPTGQRPQIWHQTGEAHLAATRQLYEKNQIEAKLMPFVEDMVAAYEWADVVIGRAGALTIAEITALGLPSILVPYPYAVDNHQQANAAQLAKAGGAILMVQSEMTPEKLANTLINFQTDLAFRLNMSRIAKQFARPNATDTVAAICLEVYREKCA